MTLIPTGILAHQVIRESDKAVLVEIDQTSAFTVRNGVPQFRTEQKWFPKKSIEWRKTVYGDELYAPAWLMRQ